MQDICQRIAVRQYWIPLVTSRASRRRCWDHLLIYTSYIALRAPVLVHLFVSFHTNCIYFFLWKNKERMFVLYEFVFLYDYILLLVWGYIQYELFCWSVYFQIKSALNCLSFTISFLLIHPRIVNKGNSGILVVLGYNFPC